MYQGTEEIVWEVFQFSSGLCEVVDIGHPVKETAGVGCRRGTSDHEGVHGRQSVDNVLQLASKRLPGVAADVQGVQGNLSQ